MQFNCNLIPAIYFIYIDAEKPFLGMLNKCLNISHQLMVWGHEVRGEKAWPNFSSGRFLRLSSGKEFSKHFLEGDRKRKEIFT